MSENEKGPTEFPSYEAFLEWLAHSKVTFLFKDAKGWKVEITKNGLRIFSPYYEVRGDPNGYGAPKVFGLLFPLGDKMVSGMIVVDPLGKVINRRRVVADDKLAEGQEIIEVIIVQPDRAIEPVAVIITEPLENYSKNKVVWADAILAAKDGVEATALRAIMKKIFK
jgi:hypothetical protein